MKYHVLFFSKIRKDVAKFVAAAVVIGALSVRLSNMTDSNIALDKIDALFSIKKGDIFLISQINSLWHSLETFWHILYNVCKYHNL